MESRIRAVTVMVDRARVTREAELVLTEGISTVELGPLPGWTDVSSLRARLLPDGQILDVRSRRGYLIHTSDADLRAAQERVTELEDRIVEIEDLRRALEEKRQQIVSVRTFASATLPAEVPRRDIPVDYFRALTEFVHASTVGADADRRALDRDLRALRPELDAARKALADLQRGNQLEQPHLSLVLRAPAAGKRLLQLEYELPGATWDAAHEIRVSEEGNVEILSMARVRQTTGEDWENATLTFSTRRPGQTVNVPQLDKLLLGGQNAVNPLQLVPTDDAAWREASRYYLDNSVRCNSLRLQGKGSEDSIEGNWRLQNDMQARSQRVFAQLEARGTTALFEAEGRYTVRSDGEEARIPFAHVQVPGRPRVFAAPEISPIAARGIELTYAHSQALLPGDAALFVEGAFIGRTRLGFAGPGEGVLLFAGSEDALKIRRSLNHKESELRRGRTTNRMNVAFVITAENTGDRPLAVRIADRIPVSDDKDIRVSAVRIDPAVVPDENGLLAWETEIPARTTRTFSLRYSVEYPVGLKRSAALSSSRGAMEPLINTGTRQPESGDSLSAPSTIDQILGLESKF